MAEAWHKLSVNAVMQALSSDAKQGLSTAEATNRLAKYGYNEFAAPKRETLWQKFIDQFKDFLILILIAASAISIAIGEITDSLVIIAIVILNAVLGVFQESKAEKALEALKRMAAPSCKVIRDGGIATIPARQVVPGDVVLLEAGDYIPADVRIMESVNLKVEEASLTGESVPIEKSAAPVPDDLPLADRYNMGYMGTTVTYGRGKGVVVGTATQTEMGKIAAMIQSFEEEVTPLQKKLAEFGKALGLLCLAVCAAVFILGIYSGYRDSILDIKEVELMVMTAISLAVAAIPEGLPAVVTIVLALGMQRMVKRNAIIKKLHAVETLGSVTVICSDKTGTLTQNQMTVAKVFAGDKLYDVSGRGYAPHGQFTLDGKPVKVPDEQNLSLLLQGAVLCNDAALQDKGDGTWCIVGDPTEGALVVAAAKGGYQQEELTRRFPRVQELPFDSNRKMMTTFHTDQDGQIIAFVKGAPDVLLARCTHISTLSQARPLTKQDLAAIDRANALMASQALRVLAVAYRRFPQVPADLTPEKVECDLTFIGLLGMIDPPRTEAAEAVNVCAAAGIRPVMITGDHPDTALAIAKSLGIAHGENQVITGRELDALSPDQLQETVKTVNVYARVSPENKVAVVDALRRNNEITAMTGDGINDAPALKKADIGVAMGITGTDVAKETADMVVTDDNFASIVAAVEEGRVIYANIRKFIYFLISCNTAEVLVVFLAELFHWPLPLLPIQLLWMNLVTDAFPALALGMEKKEPDVMQVGPRDPDEPLFNRQMVTMILIQSIVMCIAVLGAFKFSLMTYPGDLVTARTFAFFTIIASELFCAYAARSEHYSVFQIGLFSNPYMNWGVGISAVLLLISVYGPLHPIFRTIAPDVSQLDLMLGLAILPFVAAEIGKLVLKTMLPRPRRQIWQQQQ